MRNFTTSTTANVVTYSCNQEYYSPCTTEVLAKAFVGLARALGVSSHSLRHNFVQYLKTNGEGFWDHPDDYTESEKDVVDKFFAFIWQVLQSEAHDGDDFWKGRTTVFSYTNINTGKGFTWVNFIR